MIKILTLYQADKLAEQINEALEEGYVRAELIVTYRPIPEADGIIAAGMGRKCSEFHYTQVMTKE